MMWKRALAALSIVFIFAAGRNISALADDSTPGPAATEPAATEPSAATDLLGPKFTSTAYGLAFCPPIDATEIQKPLPDTIVEFDQDHYNWQLKAWRLTLQKPLPISLHKDQFGAMQDGMVESAVANLKQSLPHCRILRDEVINVGRVNVGMIAIRYDTANGARRFTQQAVIEAPDADHRLYYFLDLTGPGKPQSEPDDIENPGEKLAYDTFSQVVDSVTLLDRAAVADDQLQRLIHTRALFVVWDGNNYGPVRSAIIPEQWQRIIRDGQDVGYSYITEEIQEHAKNPDSDVIHVAVRTRTVPRTGLQLDTLTQMTSSIDRKHENWSTQINWTNPKNDLLDYASQLGISDEQTKAIALQPQVSPNGGLGGAPDQNMGPLGQGPVDLTTVRTLSVTTNHAKAPSSPFKEDVPVFYVPQAVSYLLPSLLPLDNPHTYMFAAFVPENPGGPSDISRNRAGGQVMARYLQVLPVAQVHFNNQDVQAVAITDKMGLDGIVTTHYFTPAGKFLGSSSEYTDAGHQINLAILPADADTLQRLWGNPDLTRPPDTAPSAPQ